MLMAISTNPMICGRSIWNRNIVTEPFAIGIDANGRERMQVGGKPSRYLNADLLARGRGMGFSFEDARSTHADFLQGQHAVRWQRPERAAATPRL